MVVVGVAGRADFGRGDEGGCGFFLPLVVHGDACASTAALNSSADMPLSAMSSCCSMRMVSMCAFSAHFSFRFQAASCRARSALAKTSDPDGRPHRRALRVGGACIHFTCIAVRALQGARVPDTGRQILDALGLVDFVDETLHLSSQVK